MNELDFSGRNILVVGGSSGIGNGIARAFLARGASVEVWGTRRAASDYAGDEGSRLDGLRYSQVDASDAEAVERWQPPARLDGVVLCQGIVLYDKAEFSLDGFRRVVDVNLNSLMICALRVQRQLMATQGSLVIVHSVAAYRAAIANPAYAASKTGALGLVHSLAKAWAGDGIRVNAIAPGLVDTKLTKATTGHPGRHDATLATIPAGRLGTPEDMAGAALFLMSPLASYVVGNTIVVDGGMIL